MAERLPVGATRNIKSPTPSLVSTPASSDIFNLSSVDNRLNGQPLYQNPESNISSNTTILSNGLSTPSSHSSGHARQSNSEASSRNGVKIKEGESRGENEWVEQDEPGVYITFTSLPGGAKDLKRVRFRYMCFYTCIYIFKSSIQLPFLFSIFLLLSKAKLDALDDLAPTDKFLP